MNPQNGQILKSIDLSCFAENPDHLPRPYALARARGKVYVALQDFDRSFGNHQNGKIVVLDPETDRVLSKIDLPYMKNPGDLQLSPDGQIYVAAQGILGLETDTFVVEQELSGGIAAIDPERDVVSGFLDDVRFGGNVTLLAFAAATRAYAVVAIFGLHAGSAHRENRYQVRAWDPRTFEVGSAPLYQTTGSLSFLSAMRYDAVGGTLYVAEADFARPRIVAIRNDAVDPTREIALPLPPQGMDLYAAGGTRALVVAEPDFVGGIGQVQTVEISGAPPFSAATAPDPVSSDPVVRVTGPGDAPMVFVVNRFGADNVQWLDPAAGFATRSFGGTRAQWSTGNGTNPQDVLAISETKVYVTLLN
jgi:hypothetical protein